MIAAGQNLKRLLSAKGWDDAHGRMERPVSLRSADKPASHGAESDFPTILRIIIGDCGLRAPKPSRRLPTFSPGSPLRRRNYDCGFPRSRGRRKTQDRTVPKGSTPWVISTYNPVTMSSLLIREVPDDRALIAALAPRRARPRTRHPARASRRRARRARQPRAHRRRGGDRQDRARRGDLPGSGGAGRARPRRALLRPDRDAPVRPVGRTLRALSPRRRPLPAAPGAFADRGTVGAVASQAALFRAGARLLRRPRAQPPRRPPARRSALGRPRQPRPPALPRPQLAALPLLLLATYRAR